MFAILEVLRYDFPAVYQSLVSSLEFYAYIQYPGYRWPKSCKRRIFLLYFMFWQNQCCCEHLHDHQCGHWEVPGGLPASSLQTSSDSDLQVSHCESVPVLKEEIYHRLLSNMSNAFMDVSLESIILWMTFRQEIRLKRIFLEEVQRKGVKNILLIKCAISCSGPWSTSSPRWWWRWWSACPASWR